MNSPGRLDGRTSRLGAAEDGTSKPRILRMAFGQRDQVDISVTWKAHVELTVEFVQP